jgi:hypothetical protein
MRAHFSKKRFLIPACNGKAIFLTLMALMFFDCSEVRAFNDNDDKTPDTSAYGRQVYNSNSLVDQDRGQKINLMVDYAKKQLPNLMPGMPSFLRNPHGWVANSFGHSSHNIDNDDYADGFSSFLQPIQNALHEPSVDAPQAMWVTPAYHHKGFLPVNDAMIMGFHLREGVANNIVGNNLQFDVHPFYGQNWRSTDNYWGTELAFNLSSGEANKPWGKIALRFTDGNTDLMDHGHGFDMHSQLNFNDHLSLNAGIREDGNSSAGDYVMMRWKILGD